MARFWICILALLCAFSLFYSIFLFTCSSARNQEEKAAPYFLRDWDGKIALFAAGETTPLEIYELYTHLLPEEDGENLRTGIPAATEDDVSRLLEDFGA